MLATSELHHLTHLLFVFFASLVIAYNVMAVDKRKPLSMRTE